VDKTLLICADHALAIIYFLQSEVVETLLDGGRQVVLLVDEALQDHLAGRFGRPGLSFEGLRLTQAQAYAEGEQKEIQWWLQFMRRVGGSWRLNTAAMDS
jgi:hypothetical protein